MAGQKLTLEVLPDRLHLVLSVLIFFPVFISIERSGLVSFSRPGAHHDNALYIITFPASIFFAVSLVLYVLLKEIIISGGGLKFRVQGVPLFLSFLYILNLIFYFALFGSAHGYNFLFSSFAVIFLILITSCRAFSEYLLFDIVSKYAFLVLSIPGAVASFLYIFHVYLGGDKIEFPGEILRGYFSIYNFEQYYAFSLILVLGVSIYRLKNQPFIFLSMFTVSFLISFVSENVTAMILSWIILFFYFLRCFSGRYFLYFSYLYIVFSFFLFLLFPAFSYFFVDFLGQDELGGNGFSIRMLIHYLNFEGTSFVGFLAPNADLFSQKLLAEPHHQFLSFLYSSGFLSAVILYAFYFYFVFRSRLEDIPIFVSMFFLVSTFLEPLTHPFLMIQLLFYLGCSFCANTMGRYYSDSAESKPAGS